jgi:hypothetical protein
MTIFLEALKPCIKEQLRELLNLEKEHMHSHSTFHDVPLSATQKSIIDRLDDEISRFDGTHNDAVDKQAIIALIENTKNEISSVRKYYQEHSERLINKVKPVKSNGGQALRTLDAVIASIKAFYEEIEAIEEKKKISVFNQLSHKTPTNVFYISLLYYIAIERFSPEACDADARSQKEEAVWTNWKNVTDLRPIDGLKEQKERITDALETIDTANKVIVNPPKTATQGIVKMVASYIPGFGIAKWAADQFEPKEGRLKTCVLVTKWEVETLTNQVFVPQLAQASSSSLPEGVFYKRTLISPVLEALKRCIKEQLRELLNLEKKRMSSLAMLYNQALSATQKAIIDRLDNKIIRFDSTHNDAADQKTIVALIEEAKTEVSAVRTDYQKRSEQLIYKIKPVQPNEGEVLGDLDKLIININKFYEKIAAIEKEKSLPIFNQCSYKTPASVFYTSMLYYIAAEEFSPGSYDPGTRAKKENMVWGRWKKLSSYEPSDSWGVQKERAMDVLADTAARNMLIVNPPKTSAQELTDVATSYIPGYNALWWLVSQFDPKEGRLRICVIIAKWEIEIISGRILTPASSRRNSSTSTGGVDKQSEGTGALDPSLASSGVVEKQSGGTGTLNPGLVSSGGVDKKNADAISAAALAEKAKSSLKKKARKLKNEEPLLQEEDAMEARI